MIQLQPPDDKPNKVGSVESLSSNSVSVEAKLLGLSKDVLRQHLTVVGLPTQSTNRGEEADGSTNNETRGQGDDEMSTAESSATKLHVTAIG